MKTKPIIEVKGLSKAYTIRHEAVAQQGTQTIRDAMVGLARKPLELFTGERLEKEQFWALNGVSFNVQKGEVLGVVGRNGSGKSTLLKVLSRIVEPTKGSAILRGRVASLLEVGTGFHPELTGRENVFFNGAILGMPRKEIREKFDEIIAFSGVEQFLDTPVKFYSSGMYVRLAFAVAAHLDPEILIVDEVLAVGDAAFQKKSLSKMKSIANSGRTVIFVSHSMGSIKQLCTTAILLRDGKVVEHDKVDKVINSYMNTSVGIAAGKKREVVIAEESTRFFDFTVNKIPTELDPEILSGESLKIAGKYEAKEGGQDLCVGFGLRSQSDGAYVSFTHSHLEDVHHTMGKKGSFVCDLKIPRLSPGAYTLELQIWMNGKHHIQEQELCDIHFGAAPAFRTQSILANFPSLLMVDSDWKFASNENIT